MKNLFFVFLLAVAVAGCTTVQAPSPVSPVANYSASTAVTPATSQPSYAISCNTYNNDKPGKSQLWSGVDAVEIRQNLKKNGAQLWFHSDGRWDGQGGKFSLLFPNQQALAAYCANPRPTPSELRVMTSREPTCPSSVGKGQKWLPF